MSPLAHRPRMIGIIYATIFFSENEMSYDIILQVQMQNQAKKKKKKKKKKKEYT
jgi:hypothetical protein